MAWSNPQVTTLDLEKLDSEDEEEEEGDDDETASYEHQFPSWTFHVDNPLSSSVGSLKGAYFTEPQVGSRFRVDSQFHYGLGPPLRPISSLKLLNPSTTPWEQPLDPSPEEGMADKMIGYYEANHYDSFVPKDFLKNCLEEGLQVERENYMYDPFRGNVLDIHSSTPNNQDFLAYPSGINLNELHMRPSNDLESRVQRPVIRLPNPILQIASSKVSTCTSRLLAVRDHSSITLWGHRCSESHNIGAMEGRVLDTIHFRERPLHIAFSTTLPTEAAIVLDGGELFIWDGRRSLEFRTFALATYSDSAISYAHRWKACVYGAHPRSLLVAHADKLDNIDFRSKGIVATTIFSPPTRERITAFERDPDQAYQLAVATSSKTLIVDSRYARRPLLQWQWHDNQDSPIGIQYFRPGTGGSDKPNTFLAWSRVRADIVAYAHTSPTTLLQPRFHKDFIPSVRLPPMSRSQPVILQPFRRHSALASYFLRDGHESWLGHQQSLQRKEGTPHWPPLRGVSSFMKDSDIHIFQIGDDGALYKHSYKVAQFRQQQSALRMEDHTRPSSTMPNADYRSTVELHHHADPTLPKGHEKLNWTALSNFLDWAATHSTCEDCHTDIDTNGQLLNRGSCSKFTLYELTRNRPDPPLSYSDNGIPRIPSLHSLYPSHGLSQLSAVHQADGTYPLITYPDLLPPSDNSTADTLERMIAAFFPTFAITDNVRRRFSSTESKADASIKLLAQHVYLAGRVMRRSGRDVQSDEPTPVTAEAFMIPQFQDDMIISGRPSLLRTPYSSTSLRISATATELRKRWLDADQFYGPGAPINPVNGSERVKRMGSLVKHESTANTYYSSATETSSAPLIPVKTQDDKYWVYTAPSQIWAQPEEENPEASSSFDFYSYSQPVGDSGTKKRRMRRRGF